MVMPGPGMRGEDPGPADGLPALPGSQQRGDHRLNGDQVQQLPVDHLLQRQDQQLLSVVGSPARSAAAAPKGAMAAVFSRSRTLGNEQAGRPPRFSPAGSRMSAPGARSLRETGRE